MTDEERVQALADLYETWRKGLPESRLHQARRTVHGPLGWMEECFCANCGRRLGLASQAEFSGVEHVFILCDDCVIKHGLPSLEIPGEWHYVMSAKPNEEG